MFYNDKLWLVNRIYIFNPTSEIYIEDIQLSHMKYIVSILYVYIYIDS